MYQNSIQIGLEKNEERTVEVLEADDSERHSGIAKKVQAGHFRRIGMIWENGGNLGGIPDKPMSLAFRH